MYELFLKCILTNYIFISKSVKYIPIIFSKLCYLDVWDIERVRSFLLSIN